MKRSLVVLLVVMIGGATGVVVQRRALSQLRSENLALREESQIVDRLKQENAEVLRLREATREVATLREETRDLHRLRNEIRRLTEQAAALGPLRAENLALNSASTSGSAAPPPPTPPIGATFTPDQTTPVGTATPEATLQTYFWAMRQGDYPALHNCHTPEAQAPMNKRDQEHYLEEAKQFHAQISSLRIAARQQVSADEIQLGVEIRLHGKDSPETVSFSFKRAGNEWLLDFPLFQ